MLRFDQELRRILRHTFRRISRLASYTDQPLGLSYGSTPVQKLILNMNTVGGMFQQDRVVPSSPGSLPRVDVRYASFRAFLQQHRALAVAQVPTPDLYTTCR